MLICILSVIQLVFCFLIRNTWEVFFYETKIMMSTSENSDLKLEPMRNAKERSQNDLRGKQTCLQQALRFLRQISVSKILDVPSSKLILGRITFSMFLSQYILPFINNNMVLLFLLCFFRDSFFRLC